MPIQLREEHGGTFLAVHASGRLVAGDYDHFMLQFQRLVDLHGPLHVLFDMTGLRGWSAGAFWADATFAMHHFHDIVRLAVVGEKTWQKEMAMLCKPFTKAVVRYFDHADAAEARTWLAGA